jgi:hypothetical protein
VLLENQHPRPTVRQAILGAINQADAIRITWRPLTMFIAE